MKSQLLTAAGAIAIAAGVIWLTVYVMLSQQEISGPKFDPSVKPVENYTPVVGKKWDDPK